MYSPSDRISSRQALPEPGEAAAVYEAIFGVFEMLPLAALVAKQVRCFKHSSR